jgi:hypothetical protein
VTEVIEFGEKFSAVVMVCQEAGAERCDLPQRRAAPALELPQPVQV